jgi:hypothetical protein
MKWMLVLGGVLFLISCHRDDSQPCTTGPCNFRQPSSTCALPPDTALAYQMIAGKWYLREMQSSCVQCATSCSSGTTECFSDSTKYITFSANGKEIFPNDTPVPFQLTLDTFNYVSPTYYAFAFNVHGCDTMRGYGYCYLISICDSTLGLYLSPDEFDPGMPTYTYTRTWK